MAVVRELITRFGFNVDGAAQSRVESSISRISGLLSGIAAFASLRALANVADAMQSLEARIGMLPQTIGDVGDAFNEVAKNATANRQSIDAYGTLYARVGHAAKDFIKDQKDLVKVSNTISQALVVGGATTQEAQSVMIQFSQALGSGTLQGEEFRAMAEAAPQYLDALAEAMGVPRGSMKKLASEGKITTKQVIEATLKMSSMFEEKFKQMPMTIGAATTIMANRFKTMIASMNRESQIVTAVANFMLRAFDRIEEGFNKLVDTVGGMKNTLKLLGIGVAALLGPLALGGLLSILGAILSPAGMVIGVLILIGLAIDDIVTYLEGGQSAFGGFIEWMRAGSVGASALQGALITLGAVLAAYVVYLGTLAKAWLLVQIAALRSGAAMALAWAIGIAPITAVIAGIAAVSAALMYLYHNWEKVKGFVGGLLGIKVETGPQSVAPASVATAGRSGNVVTSNQTVNLTVPPGTPEAQQKFLQTAAGMAFKDPMADLSRNLGMVAP